MKMIIGKKGRYYQREVKQSYLNKFRVLLARAHGTYRVHVKLVNITSQSREQKIFPVK